MNVFLAALAICIIGVVASLFLLTNHAAVMYQEFNRQYLAAQILEAELQHRYNDANLTIRIYAPDVVMPL